jgi:hypothetical protein
MWRKWLILVVLVITLTWLAVAQERGLERLKFGLQMAENNLFEARFLLQNREFIGLSAEQQKKVETMMLAYEEKNIRRGSEIKVLELRFATLLKPGAVDRIEMEKMVRQINTQKTELQIDHLNYLLDLRLLLTPEQIGKLEERKKEIRQRFGPPLRNSFPGSDRNA